MEPGGMLNYSASQQNSNYEQWLPPVNIEKRKMIRYVYNLVPVSVSINFDSILYSVQYADLLFLTLILNCFVNMM